MQTLLQSTSKKSPIPLIALGIVILIILSLVFTLSASDEFVLERTDLHIGTVQRGPLIRDIKAPGRFVPNTSIWITARVDARVKTKLLDAGTLVKPDSIILELSAPELTQEYRRALLDVKVAEARLQAAVALQQNDFRQQEADVDLIRIEKDLAIQEAEAQQILEKKRIITGFEYQASLLRVERLTTQLRIDLLQLSALPKLQQALLRVEQAEVEQLQLRVDLLQDQVDSLKVRAGIHGIVQSLPLEEGQQVVRGTELARVSNQEDLKAELNVQEAQARDLSIGQLVGIDTRRSKIDGRISRIDPGVINGTVLVDIQFDVLLPSEARPDLRVDGTIEVERLNDVLFIAKPMMWRPSDAASLYRLETDVMAKKIQVAYGIHSVANVQLVSGLEEGDLVILSDVSAMEAAQTISIN